MKNTFMTVTTASRLANFHRNFMAGKEVILEHSIMWYCIDMGGDWYLSLTIDEKINFKQSYFDMSTQ